MEAGNSTLRLFCFFFFHGTTALSGPVLLIIEASHSRSVRHTTLGRTPLDERSAQCRDLYLTTHSTHKRHTSMPLAGFKPTIPANEWLQTHTLDHVATRIGPRLLYERRQFELRGRDGHKLQTEAGLVK